MGMLHPWLCRQRATHPFDDSKKPGSHGHTSHGGVRRTILGCCRYCWCVTGALVDAVFWVSLGVAVVVAVAALAGWCLSRLKGRR